MPKPTSSGSPQKAAAQDSLSNALRASELTYPGAPEDGSDTSAEGDADKSQQTPHPQKSVDDSKETVPDISEPTPEEDLEKETETGLETPPEDGSSLETPPEGGTGLEMPPEGGQKPLKYKTIEEAERGQREAERRMHEATTSQARLQAQFDQMRAEHDALKLEFAQAKTARSKEEISQRMRTFLETVSSFDRDAEDFTGKSADAYRDLFSDVVPNIVDDIIEQRLEARFTVLNKTREERERLQELRKDAIEEAATQGLDMSKKSPERELFFALAQDCEGDTFEDQVDWTIKRVKALKGRLAGRVPPPPQGPQGRQRPIQPLQSPGASVLTREPVKQAERPITLNEALTASERRV